MVEVFVKLIMEKRIYWSSYYSWTFVFFDILSGPAALGISIYYIMLGKDDVNLASVFILVKILTCRMCMY
jgi:hypothetical protein